MYRYVRVLYTHLVFFYKEDLRNTTQIDENGKAHTKVLLPKNMVAPDPNTSQADPSSSDTRQSQDEEEVKSEPLTLQESFDARRKRMGKLAYQTVRQAWFTMAHLVLPPGSHVLCMNCGNGAEAYAMAVMNPKIQFTAIDTNNKAIKRASKKYTQANLQFLAGDVTETFLPRESLDAVINNFTLHHVFSKNQRSEQSITQLLQRQYDLLKEGGLIFIRDYPMQDPEEMVLIEFPDLPNKGPSLEDMSDAELLLWFSERACPNIASTASQKTMGAPLKGQNDNWKAGGFYCEELPPRYPQTRLFRLPYKWAYEFVLRKDDRKHFKDQLAIDYSFYTESDFRHALSALGARTVYSAPHWDDQIIDTRFKKRFKILSEDQTSLPPIPTSFIAMGQKVSNAASLDLQERRVQNQENEKIHISAMRDDVDGRLLDVVSRDMDIAEILPYRLTEDGRLHVIIHEDLNRPLMNAIPRNSPNIDGKKWSGHVIEAIALNSKEIDALDLEDTKTALRFSKKRLGLPINFGTLFEKGPGFYPAPDHIDEHIDTYYLNTLSIDAPVAAKTVNDFPGFSSNGSYKELDAQDILNGVFVGFIPSSRLEIQIMALYQKLGIKYETWSECPLVLQQEEPKETVRLEEVIDKLSEEKPHFQKVRGSAGQLQPARSVFVDEGQSNGAIVNLGSEDIEFITTEDKTMNVAVVLPLTKKQSGEVMAGIVHDFLPVPQRFKGNGLMIDCPSFALPNNITDFDMAKKYIAQKFELKEENVCRMGEGFFSHIGMTPQRIYPFAVASAGAKGWKKVGRTHGPCHYAPLYNVWELCYLDNYYSFMKICAMSYQMLGENSDLSLSWNLKSKQSEKHAQPVSERAKDVSSTLNSSTPGTSSQNTESTKSAKQEEQKPLEIAVSTAHDYSHDIQ